MGVGDLVPEGQVPHSTVFPTSCYTELGLFFWETAGCREKDMGGS